MLSQAAALKLPGGFYHLFRCWIIGREKLSKGKQSQASPYSNINIYSYRQIAEAHSHWGLVKAEWYYNTLKETSADIQETDSHSSTVLY